MQCLDVFKKICWIKSTLNSALSVTVMMSKDETRMNAANTVRHHDFRTVSVSGIKFVTSEVNSSNFQF